MSVPIMPPEAVLELAMCMLTFCGVTVMIALAMSLKVRRTITAVIGAVAVVGVLALGAGLAVTSTPLTKASSLFAPSRWISINCHRPPLTSTAAAWETVWVAPPPARNDRELSAELCRRPLLPEPKYHQSPGWLSGDTSAKMLKSPATLIMSPD